jgi:hypothetical protein
VRAGRRSVQQPLQDGDGALRPLRQPALRQPPRPAAPARRAAGQPAQLRRPVVLALAYIPAWPPGKNNTPQLVQFHLIMSLPLLACRSSTLKFSSKLISVCRLVRACAGGVGASVAEPPDGTGERQPEQHHRPQLRQQRACHADAAGGGARAARAGAAKERRLIGEPA